jgi:outer membrane protein assembly factor BamE
MRLKILFLRFFLPLSLLMVAGCSSVPLLHKIDIQQGNVITQEMVDKLKPGMTQSQVRFLLGSPMISDAFHKDRWDYVYYLAKKGKVREQRSVTVFFEEDKLARIAGTLVPSAAPAVAAVDPLPASTALAAPERPQSLAEPVGLTAASPPLPAAVVTPVAEVAGKAVTEIKQAAEDLAGVTTATVPAVEVPLQKQAVVATPVVSSAVLAGELAAPLAAVAATPVIASGVTATVPSVASPVSATGVSTAANALPEVAARTVTAVAAPVSAAAVTEGLDKVEAGQFIETEGLTEKIDMVESPPVSLKLATIMNSGRDLAVIDSGHSTLNASSGLASSRNISSASAMLSGGMAAAGAAAESEWMRKNSLMMRRQPVRPACVIEDEEEDLRVAAGSGKGFFGRMLEKIGL